MKDETFNDRKKRASERLPPTSRKPLTAEQQAELDALDGNPDTVDIPEVPQENWSNAYHFYKVRKEAISLRLDADVLDWLRRTHPRYQVEINNDRHGVSWQAGSVTMRFTGGEAWTHDEHEAHEKGADRASR